MNVLYEYRPGLKRMGPPKLLSKNALTSVVGFTSVFGFPDYAQEHIKSSKSTANMHNVDLYCDLLYLDFDNDPDAEDKAEQWLNSEGIKYNIYHTGNRGKHFHIPIKPLSGRGLPYKLKQWVASYFPNADLSIYKPSGIIRLPNTPHIKNPGSFKKCINRYDGVLLDIDKYETNTTFEFNAHHHDDDLDPQEIAEKVLLYVFQLVSEGGRNEHLNKIIWACKNGNLDRETCEKFVTFWNNNYCIPKQNDNECQYRIQRMYGL